MALRLTVHILGTALPIGYNQIIKRTQSQRTNGLMRISTGSAVLY